ncbi:MAG: cation diffusion facilitator family transporter [Marmoricola sp.]|nr:cation diffusion facilitator family transporter [Marmoricola sp.]
MNKARTKGGSPATTLLLAFAANVLVAVAKTSAAVLTGSAGLVAEAAHSWTDCGNQVFLLVADRRSSKPPDADRPLGYGREAYVWSLFAALGLFVAGGVVAVYHGISELSSPEKPKDFLVGYVVLVVALVLEGSSLAQALRRTAGEADALGRDTLDHALTTSDPTLRAILAEDSVAVLGVIVVAAGMALHQRTGDGVYDAAAAILVGLLLCGAAVVLIDRNRRFLTGQVADDRIIEGAFNRVRALPEVVRVAYLRLEYVGPHQLSLVASVDLLGDQPETHVAQTLRRLEQGLETDPRIVDAVLTLAVPEDPTLHVPTRNGPPPAES